jgi:hypothetical protein
MFDAGNQSTSWAVTAFNLGGATTMTMATNTLTFATTAEANRLHINNTGIGINTSTTSNYALRVDGTATGAVTFRDSAGAQVWFSATETGRVTLNGLDSTSTINIGTSGAGNTRFRVRSNGSDTFSIRAETSGGSTKFCVLENGNVGIGIGSGASEQLHVNGNTRVDGQLQIGNITTTGYAFPTTTGTLGQILEVNASGDLVFATPAGGGNTIYTADDTLAGARTVTMAGNQIHFNDGDIRITGDGTANGDIFTVRDSVGNNLIRAFEDATNTRALQVFGFSPDSRVILGAGDATTSKLRIQTKAGDLQAIRVENSGGSNLFYVNEAGTIGIGNSGVASRRLQVSGLSNGSSTYSAYIQSFSNPTLVCRDDNSVAVNATDPLGNKFFVNGNTRVDGYIGVNGSPSNQIDVFQSGGQDDGGQIRFTKPDETAFVALTGDGSTSFTNTALVRFWSQNGVGANLGGIIESKIIDTKDVVSTSIGSGILTLRAGEATTASGTIQRVENAKIFSIENGASSSTKLEIDRTGRMRLFAVSTTVSPTTVNGDVNPVQAFEVYGGTGASNGITFSTYSAVADDSTADSPRLNLRGWYDATTGLGTNIQAFNSYIETLVDTAGASPTGRLVFNVNGSTGLEISETGGIKLPNAGTPTNGYVLTSDASGNATWQAGGGGADGNGIYTGAGDNLSASHTVSLSDGVSTDYNLTFASLGDANLLQLDATNDVVNIGGASSAGKLRIDSGATGTQALTIDKFGGGNALSVWNDGFVSINNTSKRYALNVAGTVGEGVISIANDTAFFGLGLLSGRIAYSSGISTNSHVWGYDSDAVTNTFSFVEQMRLNSTGLAINASDPLGNRLFVNGNARVDGRVGINVAPDATRHLLVSGQAHFSNEFNSIQYVQIGQSPVNWDGSAALVVSNGSSQSSRILRLKHSGTAIFDVEGVGGGWDGGNTGIGGAASGTSMLNIAGKSRNGITINQTNGAGAGDPARAIEVFHTAASATTTGANVGIHLDVTGHADGAEENIAINVQNGICMLNLPTSLPTKSGVLWLDTGDGNRVKVS